MAHDDVVDIGLDELVLGIVDFVSVELLPVETHEAFVGAQKDVALPVLLHLINIVAVKSARAGIVAVDDNEVIAVEEIQAIARGNPDEATAVLKHLVGKTARQAVFSVVEFAGLGLRKGGSQ